jgi:hypothetical protein
MKIPKIELSNITIVDELIVEKTTDFGDLKIIKECPEVVRIEIGNAIIMYLSNEDCAKISEYLKQ